MICAFIHLQFTHPYLSTYDPSPITLPDFPFPVLRPPSSAAAGPPRFPPLPLRHAGCVPPRPGRCAPRSRGVGGRRGRRRGPGGPSRANGRLGARRCRGRGRSGEGRGGGRPPAGGRGRGRRPRGHASPPRTRRRAGRPPRDAWVVDEAATGRGGKRVAAPPRTRPRDGRQGHASPLWTRRRAGQGWGGAAALARRHGRGRGTPADVSALQTADRCREGGGRDRGAGERPWRTRSRDGHGGRGRGTAAKDDAPVNVTARTSSWDVAMDEAGVGWGATALAATEEAARRRPRRTSPRTCHGVQGRGDTAEDGSGEGLSWGEGAQGRHYRK